MPLYLFAFGTEGLEYVLNVTEEHEKEQDQLVSALQGKKHVIRNIGEKLNAFSLRKRFNSHRKIECYTVNVNETMAKQFQEQLYENDESIKTIIREVGQSIRL